MILEVLLYALDFVKVLKGAGAYRRFTAKSISLFLLEAAFVRSE